MLRALGYNEPENGITVEEQKSEIAKVKTLLSKASKNAKGNAGYPEFIISTRKSSRAFAITYGLTSIFTTTSMWSASSMASS